MFIWFMALSLYSGVAEGKGKPYIIYVIPASLAAAVFLIVIIIYLLRRTKTTTFPCEWLIIILWQQNKKWSTHVECFARVVWPISFNSGVHVVDDRDDIASDSLHFDFGTLRTATGNFSEENKLGQGGFGPVYSVILFLDEMYFINLFFSRPVLPPPRLWDLKG